MTCVSPGCLPLIINTQWHIDRELVAMDPGARVQGRFTWTSRVQVFPVSRRSLESNLLVNQIRLGEARRGCVDSNFHDQFSGEGAAWARRSKLFSSLALDQIRAGGFAFSSHPLLAGDVFPTFTDRLAGEGGSLDLVITWEGGEKSRIWERVPGPSLLGEHVTSSRESTADHRAQPGVSLFLLVRSAG